MSRRLCRLVDMQAPMRMYAGRGKLDLLKEVRGGFVHQLVGMCRC